VISVSIAMATCNGGAYLEEQLGSLGSQTLAPLELVIGDEGSTDNSRAIIERFAERVTFPVRLHVNSARLGFGENFIQTALRCQGDWIAFCDQDDVWSPNKLERCAKLIASGPEDLQLVVHDAWRADEELRPMSALYGYSGTSCTPALALSPEWYAFGLTQIFKAELLHAVPCSKRVSVPWHPHKDAHDVWVALLANILGSICRTDDKLLLYRRHDSAVTQTPSQSAEGWFELLRNNGAEYAQRSSYLRQVAELLSSLANGRGEVSAKLSLAADRFRIQANLLDLRANTYTAPSVFKRLAALTRLIETGGYWRGPGWPFGVKRLLKDAVFAVTGANR
jgi:glycosyltransferase involved in cell wall biosynthesis